jgi:outer membrane protein assembly factor BamE (lipoprotein component of BamABCDE complex)
MKPAVVLPFLSLLGACTLGAVGLKPGESTEAQVRRALGSPAQEFSEPGGARTLVYPTGPMGTETFMAGVDRNGRLTSLEQVLDEEHLMRIQTGTSTRDDVSRIIGPPSRTVEFTRRNQIAWIYRFRDTWGYFADFTVSFDPRGVVADKATVRIDPSNNRGGDR